MRTPRLRPLAVLALAALLPATAALAEKPYPTNTCVAEKQLDAAGYCVRALRTWAKWEKAQNDGKRDAKLARARKQLAAQWAAAEARATKAGVDCAETTAAAPELAALADSAIGAIVAGVNDGLDLTQGAHGRCGAALLTGAAGACAKVLAAESALVRTPAKDPQRTTRTAKRDKALQRLAAAAGKAGGASCPTTLTGTGLSALVAATTDAVVLNTTVSPKIPADHAQTITPTGPVSYLGREYTATCMDGSPYSFFVKRGTVNKLLMYYQGGGACWDQLTCSVPACDTNVVDAEDNPQYTTTGFGDLANPANPFRDWNIVFVSYCSCDIHYGDAAQDYPLHVEHRGFQNARIAEKFAREHFVNPEQVFHTGSSAGAYGAFFNGGYAIDKGVWPASRHQMLADAGNGVVTASFLQNQFSNWNFAANLPTDIPGVPESISEGTGIVGYTKAVTSRFPDVRWAHYTTAFDGGVGGQTSFYNIMLQDNPIGAVVWWEGSCAFNAQMETQLADTVAANAPNYRYYVGTGSRHTMFGSDKVYTDTTGGVTPLVDWVNAMLDGTPAWTNQHCTDCGLLLPGDPAPDPLVTPFEQQGSDVRIVCPAP